LKLLKIISLLKKGITKKELFNRLREISSLPPKVFYEILIAEGLPLIEKENGVFLKTAFNSYKDETYCIVDIETNGSKPINSQIIEICAVKIKNGKIIDTFDELVKASFIPPFIREITGINTNMLKNAKTQKEVLSKFREFIGDSIFVAHDSTFDYTFISAQMKKSDLGSLRNREICTLSLAHKTIEAKRYGLKYLVEELNLPEEPLHRALGDAVTTSRIFLISLSKLPEHIVTTEDLISLSDLNKKDKANRKRAKRALKIEEENKK
jgi:DNA polymerase-3 subunit epsilon